MSNELDKLICNLIGTIEILDVALNTNDINCIKLAQKIMMKQINELKKHEYYTRENGVYYK